MEGLGTVRCMKPLLPTAKEAGAQKWLGILALNFADSVPHELAPSQPELSSGAARAMHGPGARKRRLKSGSTGCSRSTVELRRGQPKLLGLVALHGESPEALGPRDKVRCSSWREQRVLRSHGAQRLS
jgi:hypothetical protein